jgi:hypothetical protein
MILQLHVPRSLLWSTWTKRGKGSGVYNMSSAVKSWTNKKLLNKEPLPYLLPIHMTIDMGTGVGEQGVLFGDGEGGFDCNVGAIDQATGVGETRCILWGWRGDRWLKCEMTCKNSTCDHHNTKWQQHCQPPTWLTHSKKAIQLSTTSVRSLEGSDSTPIYTFSWTYWAMYEFFKKSSTFLLLQGGCTQIFPVSREHIWWSIVGKYLLQNNFLFCIVARILPDCAIISQCTNAKISSKFAKS